MFFRQKRSGDRVYLQIVENRWEQGGSRQRVIATLGRLDRLRETGQLDALLESGARFSESAMVLAAHRAGEVPALVLSRPTNAVPWSHPCGRARSHRTPERLIWSSQAALR